MGEDRYRLPAITVPTAYDLELSVDVAGATFEGSVAAAVEVLGATTELVCNAVELRIDEAWVTAGDGNRIEAVARLDEPLERLHLTLAAPVGPGPCTVHVRFAGELNEKLVGFYRSSTVDSAGVEQTVAVTQFEATHARRAFPCWDEPERKATLRLVLEVPDDLTAVANSAIVDDRPAGPGRRRVTFAETMKMSTYVYAWVVGPLELTDPVDAAGTDLRIVHPPGDAALTPFALESASFALRWFADYYGIPYPGDKCDLIAVPDFAFGAMENLGCIVFREVLLLIDPERATQAELQRCADVIHHELAHMWFGDLVTMRWWNGIWLNEAFATFMEMKCTEAFRPEWDRWTDFGLARTAALDVDALTTTRAIEFEVVSPEEAEGMFDVLTYEKGAAVLRMLEQYLGEDEFRSGIRRYLADNAYGNTETTDLWDALEATTDEPVRRIADSWIFQGGYPVVSATVVDGTTLRLRQRRFLFDGDRGADELWAVPVLLRYGAGSEAHELRVLVDGLDTEIALRVAPEWIHLNVGGSGFYRVQYTAEQLGALGHRLDALTALERYQLVDDAFAAALAGATHVAEVLDLLRRFVNDSDVSVWQRIVGVLVMFDRAVDDATRPRLEATIRALAGPALQRMGDHPEPDESDRTRSLRATLFELLGAIGHDANVLARARVLHDAFLADPAAVDPAMAAASVAVIADRGGPADHEQFVTLMRAAETPQDELRYLYALARFRDPDTFAATLELAVSEVRSQNAPLLLARAMTNRERGADAWRLVRTRWAELNDKFPTSMISRMVEGVRALVDPALAADVAGFFAEHEVVHGAQTVAQTLERQRVNVAFCERERAALATALA